MSMKNPLTTWDRTSDLPICATAVSRYDTIPVKNASASVSCYTNNSTMPNLSCDTLVANERYFRVRVII